MTWRYLSCNFEYSEAVEIFNEFAFYFFAYATYWAIFKKRNLIFDFLASNSDASLESRMRKIDLVGPLFYTALVVSKVLPLLASRDLYEMFKRSLFSSIPESYYILTKTLIIVSVIFYKLLFLLSPICVVLYALGYQVLYSYKMKVLRFISNNLNSITFNCLVTKLEQVARKHKQFESIFGPLVLFCLCYNFFATVYFFILLEKLTSGRSLNFQPFDFYYFCYLAYCFLVEAIFIGLVICVSHCNDKIGGLSNDILESIELKLSQNLSSNFLLVDYLEGKIDNSFKEPLTAYKVVAVDKRVVFATAASCLSFAVLLIQINNGALVSKG